MYVEALRAYPEQVDVLNNVSVGAGGGGWEDVWRGGVGRLLTNETIKAKTPYIRRLPKLDMLDFAFYVISIFFGRNKGYLDVIFWT